MSDAPVIRLDGVRKTFARERSPASIYRALRGRLGDALLGRDGVLALDRVDCEIPRGRKIGVIGSNGSGKTTLLKLIAGLYIASEGRVDVRGEVTLLAGLGIGLIDEATVTENVRLYGAIYGIGRDEMRSLIPEILAWAELTDFADARLKTLSNGMRSRLAFSAMRHVESDIYLLDEVLSAGDLHFQKKCEQVFDAYRRGAKTFVVATHSIKFAREFCDQVLWLHKGKQKAFGDPEQVTAEYEAFAG